MSLSATLRPKSVNSIFPERPPGTIRFNARQYCPEFRIRLRSPVLLAKSTPTDSSVSLESSINSLANSSELYFIPLFNSSNFLILNNTPSKITGSFNPSVHCRHAHFHLKSENGFSGTNFLSNIFLFSFVLIKHICNSSS